MSEQASNLMEVHSAIDQEENNIDFFQIIAAVIRQKKIVIGFPIVIGVLALAVALTSTPIFTSTAKIMPPQQQSSGVTAMLGQLGSLASAGLGGSIKTPADVYVGMLESRTIADNLINRFKLKDRYEADSMDGARKDLAGVRDIVAGKKDGMISVIVRDKDPKFAAELANAHIEELTKLTQTLAVSEASLRRLFFERQLKEAKDQLAEAEVGLRKTQEKTGMIQPDGQVQALISNLAQLKAAIAAKEVQLNGMRTFATAQHPEFLRAQEELRGLKAQLLKVEKNNPSSDGDVMVPAGRIPEAGVEYVRSLRNVKYYETLFELLAKQYELAKIDEAKDASLIQLLDKALPAEKKSAPRRGVIVVAGIIGGGILGLFVAFMRDMFQRSRKSPEGRKRWQELAAAWHNKAN